MKEKLQAYGPIGIIVIVAVVAIFSVNFATGYGPGGDHAPGGVSAPGQSSTTQDSDSTTTTTTGGDGTTTEIDPSQLDPSQLSGLTGDDGSSLIPTDTGDQTGLPAELQSTQ